MAPAAAAAMAPAAAAAVAPAAAAAVAPAAAAAVAPAAAAAMAPAAAAAAGTVAEPEEASGAGTNNDAAANPADAQERNSKRLPGAGARGAGEDSPSKVPRHAAGPSQAPGAAGEQGSGAVL
ncbi:hypothetical protein HYH03_019047 [Edaphochlamys debaryana]|uniref:Uncharacterized protein n=1 Tax=Edaphochlamys debaryana TaxID=47281 RepID=A0A835XDI7_9CHLO|nr:hypothetical protein HYH03_019047 [Edaphochlamys debaryana]|eukprot:KAG2481998.1 hypothetical protein HYH03_019047 [Edaphochlamys debaryana]